MEESRNLPGEPDESQVLRFGIDHPLVYGVKWSPRQLEVVPRQQLLFPEREQEWPCWTEPRPPQSWAQRALTKDAAEARRPASGFCGTLLSSRKQQINLQLHEGANGWLRTGEDT